MLVAILIPDDATLAGAAEQAAAAGMRLYTNGQRSVISPIKPAGMWARVDIRVTTPTRARVEVQPWNA
jgi:hypothetical protein